MRFFKCMVAAVALGLIAAVPTNKAMADDAPAATQPSGKTGSVTIKVVDGAGNPVAGAKVRLIVARAKVKGEKGDKGEKAPPVAQGVTDAQGSVTLSDVPEGSYRAQANMKEVGRGRENVTVSATAAAAEAPVTITLKPQQAKDGGTPPATQPAN